MIKYSYKIQKFNITPSTKKINSVEWWYVGEENGKKYEIFNVTQLTEPSGKLIPIEKLEEKHVIKFIENSIDKEYLKSMKSVIKTEIENQNNPEELSINPPWIENV